ncbi:MAG: hypothetical protein V3571_14805 [Pseudodesulfovibrio sp.]
MHGNDAFADRLTVFYHIPKCAGITVVDFLRASFGERFSHVNSHCDWLALARRNGAAPPSGHCAAGGHYCWGVENLYPGVEEPFYFTILREPLSRMVSEYRFQVMNYRPTLSLEDYFDSHCRHNRMTHYLAGGDLELAKDRLRERFSLVGILEDMDRFMGLLADRLGVPGRTYPARNKSRNPDPSCGVDEAFEARFRKEEAKDAELYALACALHEDALRAAQGPASARPAMVTEVTDTSYVPSDPVIVDCLRRQDFPGAIALLEAKPDKGELAYRVLIGLCDRVGDEEKTLHWSLEAGRAVERMELEAYRKFERYGRYGDALDIVARQVDRLAPLVVDTPRDASINRTLEPLLDHKARLHRLAGDTPGAISAHSLSRRLFPEKWRTTLAGIPREETVPLSALDPAARCLVLRFGPVLLLETLIEGLRACGRELRPDILAQKAVASLLPQEALGAMHLVPDGRYVFDPEAPVTVRLAETEWDDVILLKNFDDLAAYAQQLRLAHCLGVQRVLVYSMDNLCLEPAARRLHPLSAADVLRAAGGRP